MSVEPLADGVEVRGLGQRSDERDAEHRPGPDHVVGQRAHPAGEFGFPPFPAHHRHGELHEVRGPAGVAAGLRVADRLRRVVVGLEPRAGPPVQLGHLVGSLVEQVRVQDVGEQVVVAVPLSAVVERHEEQVGPLQRDQRRLAAFPPVTASQSGPVRRSRTEVWSRKSRTSAGWRARTSSAR